MNHLTTLPESIIILTNLPTLRMDNYLINLIPKPIKKSLNHLDLYQIELIDGKNWKIY